MGGRTLLAVAMLSFPVVLAGAGAVAPPIADPCPGAGGVRVEMAAADGTVLRGHVHSPPGRAPPFPIVVEVSPYFGLLPGVTACPPVGPYAARVFEAGFAIALVSLRGTGESEGCLQFGGPVDVSDVGAIVEGLAAHALSDRDVALVGGSYSAFAAMAGVASRAPHLRAAVVVSPGVDWWSVHTRGGATWMPSNGLAPIPAFLPAAAFIPGVGLNAFGIAGFWGPTVPPVVNAPPASHAACPIHAEHAREDALLVVGDRTPYWAERDLRGLLDGATTPVFLVNGLRNLEEMVQQTNGLWDLLDGPKRFVLGNWNHLGMPEGFAEETVDWLLQHTSGDTLEGGARSVDVVRYQDGTNAWRTSSAWPPPGERAVLALSGSALLPPGAGVAASEQSFQSVDANPCLGLCLLPPVNYQPLCGPFQALYVSPPLASPVVLAGNFRARFTLTSTHPDGNLAAFLFASVTGACPDPAEREVRRAMGSLRHVFDERGAPFPVGEQAPVEMTSLPFVAKVNAGERLVLAIGGGAAPLMPRASHPMLTVTTGEGLAGELSFTVVEGTLAFA